MASVNKQFVARHGIAVGATPTNVFDTSGNATVANLSVSGSLQAALNLNSQILTNANIDSGTIDGATIATSNITVGSTKTLDVSAGTLTLANDQISGDKVHGGTISGVTITTPYIATVYSQAATGGTLTLRSNSTDTTTGLVSIPMSTASTTTGTGALVVTGGLGVGGNANIGGNLVLTGNLTVNGTTTTTNSTTVTIDDPIFTLGGDVAPGADDNKDRGIEFRWHNGTSAKVGFFGFDDSTGFLTFIPDATNTSEVFSGTKGTLDAYLSASDLSGGTIASSILANSTLYVGTTAIALNRGLASQALTGITSIDGSAASCTGNASTATSLAGGTQWSVPYQSAVGTTSFLAGTTDTTRRFLRTVGTGAAAQAPAWDTVTKTDVGLSNVENTALSTWAGTSSITTVGTIGTGTWNATVIADDKIASALTGKTYNGITPTAKATGFSLAGGTVSKTLTVNNSITLAGTDSTTITFPSTSGTLPLNNQTFYIGTTAIAINQGSGTITSVAVNVSGSSASCTGNAATASALTPGAAINGVSFTGAAGITVPANVADDTTTATTVYPVWVGSSTGNQSTKVTSTRLSFVPSTGVLSATSFNGPLTGTATNATNTTITDDTTTNSTFYPSFVASTGNQASKISSTSLTFNPSTGALFATSFSVNNTVSANATGTSSLFNANTTTINFGGAATTFQVGAAGSTFNLNGTTDSDAITTGALVVDGGAGIAKNVRVGGHLGLNADSSTVSLKLSISGINTNNSATVYQALLFGTLTGGASTTTLQSISNGCTYNPSVATMPTVYHDTSVANFGNSANFTTVYNKFLRLDMSNTAIGGTITDYFGMFISSPAYNASATKAVTSYTGIIVKNHVKGTGQAAEPTNVKGIVSEITSGTGRYNIYSSGTAVSYHAGKLLIGSTLESTSAKLRVFDGSIPWVEVSNSDTNSSDKTGGYNVGHYTNAEQPMGLIFGLSSASTNVVGIGGGHSALSAATNIRFYTAANNITTTGTQVAEFDSAGTFTLSGTTALKLPAGTDAQRPTGVAGMIRYSTTSGKIEAYTTSWAAICDVSSTSATANTVAMRDASADIYANNFISSSDARLKDNVINITSALDVVSALQGVTFQFKESGEKSAGFIAQEMEKVLPDLVHTNEDGMKSVNYLAVIAYLVEAIKELKQ